MSLFNISKEKAVKSKEIQIDDGTLLNEEGYHEGINDDTHAEKKESIWNKKIKFSDLTKVKSGYENIQFKIEKHKNERPVRPKSVRITALDIGSSEIKIVEGQVKAGKIKVYNMKKIKSPENIISDGEIYNQDSFLLQIKETIKSANIKTKNLAIVSSSSTIISRELVVPYVEKYEELRSLVNYEIQQFLSINLNNYVVQFMKLGEVVVDEVRKQRIFAIIYPKNIVDSYRNLAASLSLNPYSLDITNNSIRKLNFLSNVYNSDLIDKNEVSMYIDLGSNNINISILNKGKLEFIRVMPTGGSEIDKFIASYIQVSISEAEEIKKNEVDVSLNREENGLNEGVVEIIEEWVSNLTRIIQFYTNKSAGQKVKHIYLYGGTSKLKGIDQYIAIRTEIDAIKIRTVDNIEFDKNLNTTTIEEYINALGAFIRL